MDQPNQQTSQQVEVKEETSIPQELIDRRAAEETVEKETVASKETVVKEAVVQESAKPEVDPTKKVEDEPEQSKDIPEQVKAKIQKRIDKEVAKRKSAEEELAELRAENERLRAGKVDQPVATQSTQEPTEEQIDAAYEKALADGDYKFASQINRYAIKRAKETALKEYQTQEEAKQKAAKEANERQLRDWVDLNRDYKSENKELDLSNQNGLLYKTAMALFTDKELQATSYNDPNRITAFRRAVADAHKEILENNLLGNRNPDNETSSNGSGGQRPKVESRLRAQLAEPGSEVSEEPTPSSPKVESEAEIVAEEIKRRKRFHADRSRF